MTIRVPERITENRGEFFHPYHGEDLRSLGGEARQMHVVYHRERTVEGASRECIEKVKIGLSKTPWGSKGLSFEASEAGEETGRTKGIDPHAVDLEFSATGGNYCNIQQETRGSLQDMGVSRSSLLGLLRETLPDYVCNIIPRE